MLVNLVGPIATEYSDGDLCYYVSSFRHDSGSVVIEAPLGIGNMSILDVCELLCDDPLFLERVISCIAIYNVE
jgi:hypothetical protein